MKHLGSFLIINPIKSITTSLFMNGLEPWLLFPNKEWIRWTSSILSSSRNVWLSTVKVVKTGGTVSFSRDSQSLTVKVWNWTYIMYSEEYIEESVLISVPGWIGIPTVSRLSTFIHLLSQLFKHYHYYQLLVTHEESWSVTTFTKSTHLRKSWVVHPY